MKKVTYVPNEMLSLVLPAAMECLDEAIKRSNGRSDVSSVVEALMKSEQQLWVCYEEGSDEITSAAITTVKQYPRKRMVMFTYAAGNLSEIVDLIVPEVSKFAGKNECDGLEAVGRQGWVREMKKHGWRHSYSTIEIGLNGAIE